MAQAEVPDTLLMDSPHAQKELALNEPVQLRLKDRYRLQRLVKKKKNFTSFCQPTRPITCANYGNHVQIFTKSRQSMT